MSEIRNIGIICEGSTDFAVLKVVVKAVIGGDRFVLLQPDFDRLQRRDPDQPGPGWQGVRKFLQRSSIGLAMGVHDLVVVHIDADVGDLPETQRDLLHAEDDPPGGLDSLCRLVRSWVDPSVLDRIVIVLPRRRTDAWLVAAHCRRKNVEALPDPAQVLADRGILQLDEKGRPRREASVYEPLATALVPMLKQKTLSQTMPELARFVGKLKGRTKASRRAQ